jgi:Leucine-rich repeat (LRR) protein
MQVDYENVRWAQDEDSPVVWCSTGEGVLEAVNDGVTDIEVGAADASSLMEALGKVAARLTSLSLTGCSLEGAHLTRLASMLAASQLRGIGISNNPGVELAAWVEFWDKMPPSLVKYDFGDNELPNEALPRLATALARAVQAEELFLDGNLLTDIRPLLPLVSDDSGLLELDIGDNSFTDDQMPALAQAIRGSALTTLVLGRNVISDAGAVVIIKALPQTDIAILHLDSTQIGDATIDVLAEVLADSELEELHLDETKVSNAGMLRLCRVLSDSKIKLLDVGDNNLSEETVAAIEAALPQDIVVE